jgi:hypothetical protein
VVAGREHVAAHRRAQLAQARRRQRCRAGVERQAREYDGARGGAQEVAPCQVHAPNATA